MSHFVQQKTLIKRPWQCSNTVLSRGVKHLADKRCERCKHVPVLTHCENSCHLNYANTVELVHNFLKEEVWHPSDGQQMINLTKCLRPLLITASSDLSAHMCTVWTKGGRHHLDEAFSSKLQTHVLYENSQNQFQRQLHWKRTLKVTKWKAMTQLTCKEYGDNASMESGEAAELRVWAGETESTLTSPSGCTRTKMKKRTDTPYAVLQMKGWWHPCVCCILYLSRR